MRRLTKFRKFVGAACCMGGFLLAHASVADEVKVEYLPYPKKDLKRLVKTEFFLIEQEAMKNSLTGKLKQQFASWTTAVANNKEPNKISINI